VLDVPPVATAARTRDGARTVRGSAAWHARPWLGWVLPWAVFVVVSVVWLSLDSRVLDYDSARHFVNTMTLRDGFAKGDWLAPITFTNVNTYPPMAYLVGILGTLPGGRFNIDGATIAQDVVFGGLLAAGCWGTARIAYGELAGALAAVFALGSPMVVSLLHVYMLDAPQAACVAAAVWLVLLSGRFERPGISALAGIAAGAAMLVKQTSVIFLGGFLLVVLLRGGWRHWRGLLPFVIAGGIVCLPWYIQHFSELRGLTEGATGAPTPGGSSGGAAAASYVTPPRYSGKNVAWYAYDLLNVQLLAPLFVAFVAGTIAALVRFVRERRPEDPTPELVIGGLIAYLGCTYISLKDPRYTLPAMVFVAALATGWVPSLRGRARLIAAAALVACAAITFAGTSFGIGREIAIRLPGSPPTLLGERSIRIYRPDGYLAAAPRDDSAVPRLMRTLEARGITTMELDPGGDATWNTNGLELLMGEYGLSRPASYDPAHLSPDTVFLTRHLLGPGAPKPCGRISGGWGVYMIKGGNAAVPFEQYKLYCPPGFAG
jgi:4-amino-4-deoxy-L-arabinose transferase-like glycosyltransferase